MIPGVSPILVRIGIGAYLNVTWFNRNDTIEQRIDKTILSIALSEGIYRYSVYKINKLPTPIKPPKYLGKTRAAVRTAGKVAAKAGPISLGIATGAAVVNVAARIGEEIGVISESAEELAVDYSHQALFIASLGTTGTNPLEKGDEWLNVLDLISSPIQEFYDPVLGWNPFPARWLPYA